MMDGDDKYAEVRLNTTPGTRLVPPLTANLSLLQMHSACYCTAGIPELAGTMSVFCDKDDGAIAARQLKQARL